MAINQDIAEGKWKQMKGRVKEAWGKLTDDDLDRIQGKRERWEGIMQEKYGMAKENARDEFEKFRQH